MAIFQFFLAIFLLLHSGTSIKIIKDCNNPIVQDHLSSGHSFCSHACGFHDDSGFESYLHFDRCSDKGNCVCEYDCSSKASHKKFGNICKNSTLFKQETFRCRKACAKECAFGEGTICGKGNDQKANANFAICTCFCPPQSCDEGNVIGNKWRQEEGEETTMMDMEMMSTTEVSTSTMSASAGRPIDPEQRDLILKVVAVKTIITLLTIVLGYGATAVKFIIIVIYYVFLFRFISRYSFLDGVREALSSVI